MHFSVADHPTGWMQFNKHYMACVLKIIMGWQVQTPSNTSAAALSFSSSVVFGSVRMVEPFLGFRDVKLETFQFPQLQESLLQPALKGPRLLGT